MLSLTADTNIYVSALNNPRGVPMQFLKLAQARLIRLDISDAILDETLASCGASSIGRRTIFGRRNP